MRRLLHIILFVVTVAVPTISSGANLFQRWCVDSPIQGYYVGAGVGTPFIFSTFGSISANGTCTPFNISILGGVELSRVLSVEVSAGYTTSKLGAHDCCKDLYYANEDRFFAPVAGVVSYRYGDISSRSRIFTLTATPNINLFTSSPWGVFLSPKVGYGHSSATLSYGDEGVIGRGRASHFVVGGGVGGHYDICPAWRVRLVSGVDYLSGEGCDGMPQREHRSNYIWMTAISVIRKL